MSDPIGLSHPINPSELRLLLVDDDSDTLRVVTRILTRRGYLVTPADSVQAALLAAEQQTFALVISDIALPDGTGHDLVSGLKAKYPIKAIAVSGYGKAEDVAQSLGAGFDAHLTKPVTVEAVEQTIERLMRTPELPRP